MTHAEYLELWDRAASMHPGYHFAMGDVQSEYCEDDFACDICGLKSFEGSIQHQMNLISGSEPTGDWACHSLGEVCHDCACFHCNGETPEYVEAEER